MKIGCKRTRSGSRQWDRLSLLYLPRAARAGHDRCSAGGLPGLEADWDLQPEENGTVTLEPYPFRRDPLEISILARRIPKRRYADDVEFQKNAGASVVFRFEVHAARGPRKSRSRVAIA